MHKTNCMQSIEQISTWEVFSSICPLLLSLSHLPLLSANDMWVNPGLLRVNVQKTNNFVDCINVKVLQVFAGF